MSDFLDWKPSKRLIKNAKTRLSIQKIDEIAKELNCNAVSIFLGSFLLLLEKYGRQNTILINLALEHKEMPFAISTNSNMKYRELLNLVDDNLNEYIKSPRIVLEYDKKVGFYYGKKANMKNGILNVCINKINREYLVELLYDSSYYETESINYFLRHYKNLLAKTKKILGERLEEIELTDNKEIDIIKNVFNKPYKYLDANKTITDVIEFNSKIYPNKKAVVYENDFITYKELNKKANFLANILLKAGIRNNDFVAIIPERSIEMIVGILAILKSGAAYVPIDPKYPDDRIEYIINTCQPKMIFTVNKKLQFNMNIPIIDIAKINNYGDQYNPIRKQKNSDIAYSIFTSGTTGKPKGVVLVHKGLYNLVLNYKEIYGITENDTLLQFASIAFDQSVWDIFTILGLGGTLCLINDDLINEPRNLERYMEKNNVSVAALTPAYIKLLNPDNLPSLKIIESGSAAADYKDLKRWLKNRRVFNTYGPTETTVNALTYEITSSDNRILPIGTPINNLKAFIINNNHLCGVGEPGELYIGGYGVAKEYYGQPDKTSETFVNCDFDESKLYKSGDLVKYRHDGQILFIGRVDDQVKIRGFRIELGEIENCIKQLDLVKDAYLLVEEKLDGEKEIDAYIVSDNKIDTKKIKMFLESKLPYYMIPSHIYQIEKAYLTLNGKIDKKKIKQIGIKNNSKIELPKNEFEKVALKIYKQILGDDSINVTDDFYEIGGSSIRAISIISKLREQGYTYRTCDLLKAKTIRNLGELEQTVCENKKYISIDDPRYKKIITKKEEQFGSKAKSVSYLTPTQMYMLEAYRRHIVGDNFLQYFYNCPKNLNVKNLKKAINLLAIKNEALTTAIVDVKEKPVQIRFKNRNIELSIYEKVDTHKCNEICLADIKRGFDIENDPMIRFKVFKMLNGDIKLLFSVSHIIVDGWSVELVIQDLSEMYEKLESGIEYDEIKTKWSSIKNTSLLESCLAIINDDENEEATTYWNKYFRYIGQSKTIPYDENEKNIISSNTENWSSVDWIDEERTTRIKKFCKKNLISENTLFELAYAWLLAISNNSSSSFFYKVISGRNLPVENIDNIVGMLINIIPQTINLNNNIASDLKRLNDRLLLNSKYDRYDFYHKMINHKFLMSEGKTIFVFSNYYELTSSIFEYEFDRDQDEVDMSFFVDSMKNKYQILITGRKNLYTEKRIKTISELYKKILTKICEEESLDGLYL